MDKGKENVAKALIILGNLLNRMEFVERAGTYKLTGAITNAEAHAVQLGYNFMAEHNGEKPRIW
jgi:hypothetical protein